MRPVVSEGKQKYKMAQAKTEEDPQDEESPLELIYWMLEVSGMMVRPGSKYPRLVRLNTWLQCSNLIIFTISVFLHIIVGDASFKEKLEAGQFFVSSLHVCGKQFNIFLRQKKAAQFFSVIEDMWKDAKNDKRNLKIFRITKKTSYNTAYILLPAYVGTWPLILIMWGVTNIYLMKEGRRLPMETWIPFDRQKYFWLASFYQMFIFHSAALSCGVSITLVRVISDQVTAQMKILQNVLVNRTGDREGQLKSYLLHQRILKLVTDMNAFFSGQYMFEMAASALQISIRGYTCIRGISEHDGMTITYLLLFVLTLIAPFSICSSGTDISEQADRIHEMAYQNSWYIENGKTANDLLLLQIMTTKPVNLHYRHLLVFSFEQFTTLMQATYSYLTMIRHFDGSLGD